MQIGLSPKVALPAAILLALGGALVALGLITADDTLLQAGTVILGINGVQFSAGYLAQPGNVQPRQLNEPGNDELLAQGANKAAMSKAAARFVEQVAKPEHDR